MKCLAKIFQSPEESQEVMISFDAHKIKKFFGNKSTVFVRECNVIEPLTILPSDIQTDLTVAIAEIMMESENDIRFECLIEYQVVVAVTEVLDTQTLFI
jgi:hypothetical protein